MLETTPVNPCHPRSARNPSWPSNNPCQPLSPAVRERLSRSLTKLIRCRHHCFQHRKRPTRTHFQICIREKPELAIRGLRRWAPVICRHRRRRRSDIRAHEPKAVRPGCENLSHRDIRFRTERIPIILVEILFEIGVGLHGPVAGLLRPNDI